MRLGWERQDARSGRGLITGEGGCTLFWLDGPTPGLPRTLPQTLQRGDRAINALTPQLQFGQQTRNIGSQYGAFLAPAATDRAKIYFLFHF
jgi:hypothetical protein